MKWKQMNRTRNSFSIKALKLYPINSGWIFLIVLKFVNEMNKEIFSFLILSYSKFILFFFIEFLF